MTVSCCGGSRGEMGERDGSLCCGLVHTIPPLLIESLYFSRLAGRHAHCRSLFQYSTNNSKLLVTGSASPSDNPLPANATRHLVAMWRLAVFDPRLDIRIGQFDEPAQRSRVCRRFRSQLHMAHELPAAFQQAGRIRQRCAVKESHVYVRSEYIDVAERRISQTGNRTAVVQKLPDFVPAVSHHLEPLMRDRSQSTVMRFYPRIDGGIPLDCTVESQQGRSHRRPTLRFLDLRLRSALIFPPAIARFN